MISVKYKVLAVKENKSQKRKQTQTQEIYPASILVTYIQSPKPPAWDFPLTFDFEHPKSTPCAPLDKSPLPNVYNSSYNQEDHNTLYKLSLSDYNWSYKSWICMWSWTRAIIGGLSEIFTME